MRLADFRRSLREVPCLVESPKDRGIYVLKGTGYYCYITMTKNLHPYSTIKFEEVFEQVSESLQEQLVYHFNLFTNSGEFIIAWSHGGYYLKADKNV